MTRSKKLLIASAAVLAPLAVGSSASATTTTTPPAAPATAVATAAAESNVVPPEYTALAMSTWNTVLAEKGLENVHFVSCASEFAAAPSEPDQSILSVVSSLCFARSGDMMNYQFVSANIVHMADPTDPAKANLVVFYAELDVDQATLADPQVIPTGVVPVIPPA